MRGLCSTASWSSCAPGCKHEHHSASHALAGNRTAYKLPCLRRMHYRCPKSIHLRDILASSETWDPHSMGHRMSHALTMWKPPAGTKQQVCHLGVDFLTPLVACNFLVPSGSSIPWRLLLPSDARDTGSRLPQPSERIVSPTTEATTTRTSRSSLGSWSKVAWSSACPMAKRWQSAANAPVTVNQEGDVQLGDVCLPSGLRVAYNFLRAEMRIAPVIAQARQYTRALWRCVPRTAISRAAAATSKQVLNKTRVEVLQPRLQFPQPNLTQGWGPPGAHLVPRGLNRLWFFLGGGRCTSPRSPLALTPSDWEALCCSGSTMEMLRAWSCGLFCACKCAIGRWNFSPTCFHRRTQSAPAALLRLLRTGRDAAWSRPALPTSVCKELLQSRRQHKVPPAGSVSTGDEVEEGGGFAVPAATNHKSKHNQATPPATGSSFPVLELERSIPSTSRSTFINDHASKCFQAKLWQGHGLDQAMFIWRARARSAISEQSTAIC